MSSAGEVARTSLIGPDEERNQTQERIRLLEASLAEAEARYQDVINSRAWKWARAISRLSRVLAPTGSWRYRTLRALWRGLWGGRIQKAYAPNLAPKSALPDPLQQALARVSHRPAVLFPPSIPWTTTLFQRPQHLARAWARAGYVAIYDCSGTNENLEGWRELEPNLFLYRGPQEALVQLSEVILWAFTYNLPYAQAFGDRACLVYDWIDDLGVFPYDQGWLQKLHQQGLRDADVVVSVARRLHESARVVRPDAIYLPNAVEYQRFASENTRVSPDPVFEKVLALGRPVAGYYGALASWFDYALLRQVARGRRDWSFVLIGPNYEDALTGQPLLQEPNVTWLGPRPYESLPGYLKGFDVTLIPFVLNDITRATSPLKLFEFFAAGKPVISTAMPECQAHPQVFVGNTAEDFIRTLDHALAASREPTYRERLRAEGARNSWESRVATVLPALQAKIGTSRKAA